LVEGWGFGQGWGLEIKQENQGLIASKLTPLDRALKINFTGALCTSIKIQ
jgi:hypothetical protein